MAYYGVLMKDGTELTHYGVKGMKWGKKLFGKVKGIFGKPNTRYGSGMTNQGAFDRLNELDRGYRNQYKTDRNLIQKRSTNNGWAGIQRAKQEDRLVEYAKTRGDSLTSSLYKDYWNKKSHKQANTIKRHSSRINGR